VLAQITDLTGRRYLAGALSSEVNVQQWIADATTNLGSCGGQLMLYDRGHFMVSRTPCTQ
jgi:hypothetical protein